MGQQIVSAVLGFLLGILATILLQWLLRRLRFADPARKRKLEHLHNLEKWMDSYRALFDSTYPECPELVLAHKMLSPKYPYYDQAGPVHLYNALREYRTLLLKHEELARQGGASLQALSDRRLDRLHQLNLAASAAFQKVGLLKKSLLFPVNFPTDLDDHLRIIEQYRRKVFEEFPQKIIKAIDWDELDRVAPGQLASVVHPQLDYFQADEETSRDREKESRLFDEMQNLSFYRIVAKKEIESILHKIRRQEEKYSRGGE